MVDSHSRLAYFTSLVIRHLFTVDSHSRLAYFTSLVNQTSFYNMVDLHSRLTYFTSLVRQTSVHNMVDSHLLMVDSFYFTWVDWHQTRPFCSSHLFSHILLHLGRLALDICSQYGRLFCSLLVLAYFTSLGQTLIRHLFTISVQYGIRHLLCPECRQVAFLVSSLQVLIGCCSCVLVSSLQTQDS